MSKVLNNRELTDRLVKLEKRVEALERKLRSQKVMKIKREGVS